MLQPLRIDATEKKISSLNSEIAKLDAEIAAKDQEIKDTVKLFCDRMRANYMAGETSVLEIFTSSSDMSSFLNRLEMFKRVTESDQDLMNDTKTRAVLISSAIILFSFFIHNSSTFLEILLYGNKTSYSTGNNTYSKESNKKVYRIIGKRYNCKAPAYHCKHLGNR